MKTPLTGLLKAMAILVSLCGQVAIAAEIEPKVFVCKTRYASDYWIKRSAPPPTDEYRIHQLFWIEIFFPDLGITVVHPISRSIDYFIDDNSDTPAYPYTFTASPDRYAAEEASIPTDYRSGPYMKFAFSPERQFRLTGERKNELVEYFKKHPPHKVPVEHIYLEILTKYKMQNNKGADQPATAPQLKSDSKENPKPESEVRPR